MKEEIIPEVSNKFLFVLGPSLFMITALMTGVVIPWGDFLNIGGVDYSLQITDINIGILYKRVGVVIPMRYVVTAGIVLRQSPGAAHHGGHVSERG